ncbi:MAG TPA: histidine kinase [Vicinamibacterales bacterium]|jgi:two-component system LytT family sensor kinase|nr:histidine kinase [Vicinamibacterales bacterium]
MVRTRDAAGAVAVFWVFVALLYSGQLWWLSRQPGEHINLRGALAWQATYYVVWAPFTLLVWRITNGWLPERFGWPRFLARHAAVCAVIAIAHLTVTTVVAFLLAPPRANESIAAMLPGQILSRLHLQILTYTAIAGLGAALTLQAQYRDRQLAAARLEAELGAARLDALRVQLQPHFLFNSLHSIASLARAGDNAGVVRLIAGFSDLLRHLLDTTDRHLTLRDELTLVERYLEIQRVRFADRLQATIELAPDAADARVPLLIVQPLVENALRHGLAPRIDPGTLHVRAARDNGWTRIDVEDSGVGLPPGWTLDAATGTGLRNLSSRLAAEFGTACALEIEPRAGGGVRASVRIPFVSA